MLKMERHKQFSSSVKPSYVKLVSQIHATAEDLGLREAETGFAEGVAQRREKLWHERWGNSLAPSKRIPCVHALVSPRNPRCGLSKCMKGADHSVLWNLAGKPFIFTTQPYNYGGSELTADVALCDSLDLYVEINADKGWYYPSHALLVTVMRKTWLEEWDQWKQATNRFA